MDMDDLEKKASTTTAKVLLLSHMRGKVSVCAARSERCHSRLSRNTHFRRGQQLTHCLARHLLLCSCVFKKNNRGPSPRKLWLQRQVFWRMLGASNNVGKLQQEGTEIYALQVFSLPDAMFGGSHGNHSCRCVTWTGCTRSATSTASPWLKIVPTPSVSSGVASNWVTAPRSVSI